MISQRQKTGVKKESFLETYTFPGGNAVLEVFVFAWVVSLTAIALQVNQAKHEQNYFQDQNLKASVPKCNFLKLIVLQMKTIQMVDSKSLLSLPLSLVVQ